MGAYRIGGQAYVSCLYGVGVHTVSSEEGRILGLPFSIGFAFIPWPPGLIIIKAIVGWYVGGKIQPWLMPDYVAGNDIINLDTYGQLDSYVSHIVIARGLIVNFVYQPFWEYYNLPAGP